MIGKALVLLTWGAASLLWIFGGIGIPFLLLALLHGAEIFSIGLKTGRENDIPPLKSALLTFIFGFTWWLPLRRKEK
ncbi:hypothetical protein [Spirochaeta isovalerica]|uniref:DUF1145 domain-containing protein n=1 Tax=Spirochaeta isovalerica TaxID=150 RepID=A0A841R9L2_9SPIO|nr:hypothetical protein [Spirochaeta isovalerica]MBB6479629.1 hypothetical protein [Spirochaeta isovalerica]